MLSLWKVFLPLAVLSVGLCGVLPNEEAEAQVLDLSQLDIPLSDEKNSAFLERIQNALDSDNVDQQVAIINDYIDEVVTNMNVYVKENGYDPIELEGLESSFKWGFVTGWVIFDQGILHGLGSFKRIGDVSVKYLYPNLQMHAQLGFSSLKFNYRYVIKFMYMGPRGRVDGSSKNNKFTIDINLDMVTLKAKLNKFKLNTLGSVSIKLRGNVLTDWLVNIVIFTVTPIVKLILSGVIEGFVVDLINMVLTYYNDLVCQLLQHCF